LTRLNALAPSIYDELRATAEGRWIGAYCGVPVGLAIFIGALIYQGRTKSERLRVLKVRR